MSQASKVAYLGPPGTYSQAAALKHFGADAALLACSTIEDAFAAVETAAVEYAIVPVENSTEGVVNNTQDCLVDSTATIIGEVIMPINHHLMVGPAWQDAKIERVLSHKQSLGQCRNWLRAHYPKAQLVDCVSNAEAALRASQEAGTAAIAGEIAAEKYDLHIKARSIQDESHNQTRFLVLGKGTPPATGQDKTSVLIYAENRPGALFRVLEPFENLQISLTKIDSRPAKKAAWEYVFFIDFEGHQQDGNVMQLFERLHRCTQAVKILGSYPAQKEGPVHD